MQETWQRYIPRDWVFPLVLALFVGVAVWFGRSIHDFLLPSADTVTVPSFVGQTLKDAQNEIPRLKLASAVISHGTSDRYPKGVVMNQQPEAGSSVRQGRQISFVVSDGILARLMPDLRYQSMREVNLDLARAQLQLGNITYARSDVVPENHVIEQVPAPLTNVGQGDKVDLTVSKGGAPSLRVPNFVGMQIDEARAAAAKAGIKLGQIVWTPLGSSGPVHGQVARQMPDPGANVSSYDPVSLQVSAGPNESGYIVRQVHVLVAIPVPEGAQLGPQMKVRISVTDETGSYNFYNAYAQPGQKLDFTVTAIGTSVVDLFINDALIGETRLGVEPGELYNTKPTPGAT
jgi:beta-lactam-binding protein with PASTA domain